MLGSSPGYHVKAWESAVCSCQGSHHCQALGTAAVLRASAERAVAEPATATLATCRKDQQVISTLATSTTLQKPLCLLRVTSGLLIRTNDLCLTYSETGGRDLVTFVHSTGKPGEPRTHSSGSRLDSGKTVPSLPTVYINSNPFRICQDGEYRILSAQSILISSQLHVLWR